MIGLLLACSEPDVLPFHFDRPVAATILAEGVGPFDATTAWVANLGSGAITPLDLDTGRLLTDDAHASFLRASAVQTGRTRLLQDVAVHATETTVTLWAIDTANAVVVQAPYVIGLDDDGYPREVTPVVTEPQFEDADASGDTPTMSAVVVRPGWTTTEDWTIEYQGGRWWAFGSRSGKQVREPVAGELYWSDFREIELTLEGTATEGDRFTFHTETQVDEVDLGVLPTALLVRGDELWVGGADGVVRVLDANTGAVRAEVVLDGAVDTDAQAGRMAPGPEGIVYVADTALPLVHVVDTATLEDTPFEVAGPVVDVAYQEGEGPDDTPFQRLFVAPAGEGRVDVYDALTGTPVDPNPRTADVGGVYLGSPVVGLGVSVGPVRMQVPTYWGAFPEVPTVIVSTGDGWVFQLDASTGCAVTTGAGATGPNEDDEFALLEDREPESDSALLLDPYEEEQAVGSLCGGVTRDETWSVTYSSATLDWTVEGSLSGLQATTARDDERYISDTGAVSFLITAGTLPPTDGDRFEFAMASGLQRFYVSDANEDGDPDDNGWLLPARPVGYTLEGGPTGGGWDEYEPQPYALLPVTNSHAAVRLDLSAGTSTERWD